MSPMNIRNLSHWHAITLLRCAHSPKRRGNPIQTVSVERPMSLNALFNLPTKHTLLVFFHALQDFRKQSRIVLSGNLPNPKELLSTKIFTSKDHEFIIDLFEFKALSTGEQSAQISEFDLEDHVISNKPYSMTSNAVKAKEFRSPASGCQRMQFWKKLVAWPS